MKITPTGYLLHELEKLGYKFDAKEAIDIKESFYHQFLEEASRLHPNYSTERKEAWAVYSALTHPNARNVPAAAPPQPLPSRMNWGMALHIINAVILLSILITLILK